MVRGVEGQHQGRLRVGHALIARPQRPHPTQQLWEAGFHVHFLRRKRFLRPRRAAQYAKTVLMFSDILAGTRHALWTQALPFSMSLATPDIQKRPQPLPAPLLAALCYSA